jgi:hypothetical protein
MEKKKRTLGKIEQRQKENEINFKKRKVTKDKGRKEDKGC